MDIESTAPGRICLFGEHQDYMSLSVITAAIDLKIRITGSAEVEGDGIAVSLPDIGDSINFSSENIKYAHRKDYVRSVVNVLKKKRLLNLNSVNAEINGNIPIKAGTSSSSALTVAWSGFLMGMKFTADKISEMTKEIAEIAYIAEVEEFGENGGRMDQYASAFGGINYFTFYDGIVAEKLNTTLGSFVLGDSGQPKNTQKTLKRVRTGQESGLKELSGYYKFNKNSEIDLDKATEYFPKISRDVRPYLEAVLINHSITESAKIELRNITPDDMKIATLMNMHHSILRDKLKLSTEKIEKMIDASLNAGALSAKINGSGEGGCMFAYCPGKEKEVAEAIMSAGGTPYMINVCEGLKVRITE